MLAQQKKNRAFPYWRTGEDQMPMKWQREKGLFWPTYVLKNGEQVIFTLRQTGWLISQNRPLQIRNEALTLELRYAGSVSGFRGKIIDVRTSESIAEVTISLVHLFALQIKGALGQGSVSLGKVTTTEGDVFEMELSLRPGVEAKVTATSGSKSMSFKLHGKDMDLATEMDMRNRHAAAICLAVSMWFLGGGAFRQFTY